MLTTRQRTHARKRPERGAESRAGMCVILEDIRGSYIVWLASVILPFHRALQHCAHVAGRYETRGTYWLQGVRAFGRGRLRIVTMKMSPSHDTTRRRCRRVNGHITTVRFATNLGSWRKTHDSTATRQTPSLTRARTRCRVSCLTTTRLVSVTNRQKL